MDLWVTERHEDVAGITLKVKETLFQGQSPFQKVDIIDTEAYGRMMLLDGMVMVTEKDEFVYHELITHVPMLTHPNPETVLVIGGGDGGTVREVLRHPSVKKVVLCEIDDMVIQSSKEFLPSMASQLSDPRVEIQVKDGVAYIATQKNQFDVILIDSTDPLGPGEGLFTNAFYQDVKAALKPGGLMVAQSESPFVDQKEIRLMYALLNDVFPVVVPYVGPIPTYPGGYWSWAFCSNGPKPLEQYRLSEALKLEKVTQYYNTQIHQACFAIPNFLKSLLAEKNIVAPFPALKPELAASC